MDKTRADSLESLAPQPWRSLEERAGDPAVRSWLENEFAPDALSVSGVSRRSFLSLTAASLAAAALEGCTKQPPEQIVPRAKAPEYSIPGRPLFYATAIPFRGIAQPVLVESHEGRPTRLDGNPDHPASRGSAGIFTQAAIWSMYDPDRSQVLTRRGQIATWSAFSEAVDAALQRAESMQGAGLRFLIEPTSSPTFHRQIAAIRRRFPRSRVHQHDPVPRAGAEGASRIAFGRPLEAQYHLDRASVIVSLNADFMTSAPDAVRLARDFADGRRIRAGHASMNRLYQIEPSPSVTGIAADHRRIARPGEMPALAKQLFDALSPSPASKGSGDRWVKAAAADLLQGRGTGVVIAGDAEPVAVHLLAIAMNQALGHFGRTITFTRPVTIPPDSDQPFGSLEELIRDLNDRRVDLLVILGGNPAYNAPAELELAPALARAGLSIRLGMIDDETSAGCEWHLPESHTLESWSDLRAADGTATIVQPLIAPLYQTRSAHELLAMFTGEPPATGPQCVQATWRELWPAGAFDAQWQRSVHDGFVAGSTFPAEPMTFDDAAVHRALDSHDFRAPPHGVSIDIVIRPSETVWDGRYANCPWLQELPQPTTKLTWDNAVLLSPATAARLGAADDTIVEIESGGRRVEGSILIAPGQADDCATVHLGYGRTRGGRIANGVGFNAYAIRDKQDPWIVRGASLRVTDRRHLLARTQNHHVMEGRDIIRMSSISSFGAARKGDASPPGRENAHGDIALSLYPDHHHVDNAWGMSIDLSTCIGCNACMIACQIENNISSVGRDQVIAGREMQWIRVDRYYVGEPADPDIAFQPVPCMQCENAPCEVVCPVGATVHSNDGLNDMVYNRCVGTRYCSNNCPYKVRRFNFYHYADDETPSLKLLHNPDVTVRSRGVMEKCTYCVQRISAARIQAALQDRPIRDGDIVTACQSACPTQAIVFGDLNDPNSRVSRLKREPQDYTLLAELNTRPHTTYLARYRNPHPDLEAAPS